MKMFHKPRKSLVAFAIASAIGSAAFVSTSAQAVNLSPDGLGQVQIFPYYTVKNGHDTYIHLTNTSADTVAVKIRFREAKNSREVRDFNIVLSPYDMWTGAVTGSGEGAKVVTFDKSCTSPRLLASAIEGATEVEFTSVAYDGSSADYKYDNGGTTIARTQEGYFEVIAMGASSLSTNQSSNVVEYNAKHVNGVPRNCDLVDAAFDGAYGTELSGEPEFASWGPAGNVLKGFSTLINVASGQAVGIEPTTLANFTDETLLYPPGDLLPDLNSGNSLTANYVNDAGALASFTAGLGDGVDAVSALLQRRFVINEYTSTTAGTTATDWVLTFPTKHNYVDDGGENEYTPAAPGVAIAPFDEWFAKNTTDLTNVSGKSCVEVTLAQYDREEKTAAPSGTQFSPVTSAGRNELCNEVNVLSFNGSDVLGSSVKYNINTSSVGQAGWMNLRLATGTGEGVLAPVAGDTLLGLPVIGFGMVMRYNTAEAGNNRNYGVAQEHSFLRQAVAP